MGREGEREKERERERERERDEEERESKREREREREREQERDSKLPLSFIWINTNLRRSSFSVFLAKVKSLTLLCTFNNSGVRSL